MRLEKTPSQDTHVRLTASYLQQALLAGRSPLQLLLLPLAPVAAQRSRRARLEHVACHLVGVLQEQLRQKDVIAGEAFDANLKVMTAGL